MTPSATTVGAVPSVTVTGPAEQRPFGNPSCVPGEGDDAVTQPPKVKVFVLSVTDFTGGGAVLTIA